MKEEAKKRMLEHYKNPRNYGNPSWEYTHKAKVDNLACGDSVTVYLHIENDKIDEISFEGEGCSICIGTASQIYDSILGKSLGDIQSLDEQGVLTIIDLELNKSRKKCALLSLEAIKNALTSPS